MKGKDGLDITRKNLSPLCSFFTTTSNSACERYFELNGNMDTGILAQNPRVKSPALWYVHCSCYLIFDHINVSSDWLEER